MDINDYEGGFYVERLTGTRRACDAEELFRAACVADERIVDKTDFFISMYRFPAEFVRQVKETGKTAGYAGACWSRFLWWDIDREGDLATAISDTKKLVDYLIYGDTRTAGFIVPNMGNVLVAFSGKKGFHVGIPISVFGKQAAPSERFAAECKAVAMEVASLAGVTTDPTIYDRVRLLRCLNSRHGETNLYKIPLSCFELSAGNMNAIMKCAERPRRLVELPAKISKVDDMIFSSSASEMPVAAELWRRVCESMPTGRQREKDTDEQTEPVFHQMQPLPSSWEEVPRLRRETFDYIRHGAKEGRRAVTLFNAAADCTRCGWSREAVFSVLVDVARETGLHISEIEREINCGIKKGQEG